ncbi:MAG: 2-amino-4-hydroxy-6-hydroxymethyldihydropteridine diphosphokinase [Methylophilaceae bacterium]
MRLGILTLFKELYVSSQSSLFKTSPVGFEDQPDFINAVVAIAFAGDPELLLKNLLDIEILFGRIRKERNGPRTLDLDILLFKKLHVMKNDLVIPHPRMHERLFVLLPLFEVAPDIVIEPHGAIKDLIKQAPKDVVEKILL